MIKLLLFSSFAFLTHCGHANAAINAKREIDLASQESKVEFLAIGKPSLIKIHGSGSRIKGKIESNANAISAQFIVPLKPLTTGVEMRDEHMKTKYLEVEKYPDAVLKISELKLASDPFQKSVDLKDVPFNGKLQIHGEEKDVSGTFDVVSDEKSVSIKAKTKTTIPAHKIAIPSYMGIKVADDVEISAEIKIKK